jgi:signal transduction histidine kinase
MARRAPFALVLLGVALGLLAEWAALERGPLEAPATTADRWLAAGDLTVGLVLITCGVAAWTRRRESLTGPLLAAAGFAWFLGTFAGSGAATFADFGAVFLTLHRGFLVHALLSYPGGRVERWRERATIASAYVLALVPDLGNLAAAQIALAVAVVAVAADRLRRASGPERRARAVAAVAGGAFSAVLVSAAAASLAGAGGGVDRAVLWAYQAVIAAVAVALALDLVLGRWVSATVTGLVVDLGAPTQSRPLRDRLARALGDPTLVVGYWVADRGVYVDDAGRELELPDDDGVRTVTIVRDGDEPVAALVHDRAVLADAELVRSVAAAARIALANATLHAAVVRQIVEVDASRRRMLEAADEERSRLAHELREGAERRLAAIEQLVGEAETRASGQLAAQLSETHAQVEQARTELREFARGVHPRVLTEHGLAEALRDLAARSQVPVELTVPKRRFARPAEVAAYFVCSEALANVAKYADASRVVVDIAARDAALVVSVRDDGRGGAVVEDGSGLRGLVDRVEALGGRLTVRSPAGEGTLIVAELPSA